jgi:hypothetical protein
MSAGPAAWLEESGAQVPRMATSAVVGSARLSEGALVAQGAVIRSRDGSVEVGNKYPEPFADHVNRFSMPAMRLVEGIPLWSES